MQKQHQSMIARQTEMLRVALELFLPQIKSRGRDYFQTGRVVDVECPADDTISGSVSGSELYHASWVFTMTGGGGGYWRNVCSCPMETNCKHAYALGLAALALTAGDDFKSHPHLSPSLSALPKSNSAGGALARQLADANRRPLTASELMFVSKLAKLWSGHRNGFAIRPDELYQLTEHPDMLRGRQFYEYPMAGWWETYPGTPLELWQYLAHYLHGKKIPVPAFLAPLTDTRAVAEKIAGLRRRRELERWHGILEHALPVTVAAKPKRAALLPHAARLACRQGVLQWQCRATPDDDWQDARAAWVKEWFRRAASPPADATSAPAAPLAPSVAALVRAVWAASFNVTDAYYYKASAAALDLHSPLAARLLAMLAGNPELAALFSAGNGEPFNPEPVRLVWRGTPARNDSVSLEIVQADGAPFPRDALPLTAGDGAAKLLADPQRGRLYLMPPALGQAQETAHVIPRDALAGALGRRVLRHLGARLEGVNLPESRVVTLTPRFICRQVSDSGRERLHLELRAESQDRAVSRRHTPRGWRDDEKLTASDALDIDMEPADRAVPLLDELSLRWDDPYSDRSHYRAAMGKNFPEQFLAWVEHARELGADIECDPALAAFLREPDTASLNVSLAPAAGEGIDWFDLELAVSASDTELTADEIKLLLQARGRFVLLKGKGWRRLRLSLGDEQREQLDQLGLSVDNAGGKVQRQRVHTLQLSGDDLRDLLPERQAEALRQRRDQLRAIPPPPVPASLTATLRPYQLDGYHFLAHLADNGLGGILADDMGLGKTVQALAWLLRLSAQRAADGQPPLRALVVCPKSVVPNWQIESAQFSTPLTVGFLPKNGSLPDTPLTVINYAQLRRHADALSRPAWDAVILDEGQNIKNPGSQTARAARALRAAHRLVLTGTPIENSTLDLWSLFAFAMPGLLGGQAAFKRDYGDRNADAHLARQRLARRVKHFMLRRTKSQVATDLPPRIEESLFVELEGEQRKLYQAELKRARQMLLNLSGAAEFNDQRFNILQSLLRLRQICCHPALVGADLERVESAKVSALLEQLEPILAEGHKVLVFSQFVTMLEILRRELAARDLKFLMLTGQTENRQELINRFQTTRDEQIFLLSLKAAGSGLNLTAASYVILFDPWWNPAVEAQAIDRTHRIGQTNQVIAYRLLAKDTIEEKIRQLQEHKAAVAQSIVQEENLASVLNLDDLKFVLS